MSRATVYLFALTAILSLTGCESASYYSHVAAGQIELLWQRRPVAEVIDDAETEPALRQKLELAQGIRDYASERLLLPDNDSYRGYVDLDRSYVVWNVFAAEATSISPRQWCFPVAGCVSYRGYFDQPKAQDFAESLRQQGLDTYVGGVAAYSSLGWFDDPLLNTFIERDDIGLAALMFHELAHQQLYLPGDTVFNESFASALAYQALEQWLAEYQADDELRRQSLQRYRRGDQQRQAFIELVLSLRQRLDGVYRQDLSEAEKLELKEQILTVFVETEVPAFHQYWQNRNYHRWLTEDLNNAKLLTVASYQQWLPAFRQLWAEQYGDWQAFYSEAERLSELPVEAREQALQQLDRRFRSETEKNKTQQR